MSKIPQGEWNAIAARYQNGELISRIARTYGCTPPAIHYILKRNRQRPAETAAQPPQIRPAEAAHPQLVRANRAEPTATAAAPAAQLANGAAGSSLLRATAPGPTPDAGTGERPAYSATIPAAPPARPGFLDPAEKPAHRAANPPAETPGLDSELHLRAETAIEIFRSSFDAALVEGSPGVRERLRQAATDLMRVAARTTIVLDRLDAAGERSARAYDYPRSAHAGEEYGKLG